MSGYDLLLEHRVIASFDFAAIDEGYHVFEFACRLAELYLTRQLYQLSNAVTGLPVFPETIDRYCSSPLRGLKIHTKRATIYSIEGVIAKQSFHLAGELSRELNQACIHLAAGLIDHGVNFNKIPA